MIDLNEQINWSALFAIDSNTVGAQVERNGIQNTSLFEQ